LTVGAPKLTRLDDDKRMELLPQLPPRTSRAAELRVRLFPFIRIAFILQIPRMPRHVVLGSTA
jgi:hypothetical protein